MNTALKTGSTLAAFAAIVVMPFILDGFYLVLVTEALIMAVFVMSLDILIGYSGLYSFGHAAFFGTGAYTAAILASRVTENIWVCLIGAVLASLLLSCVFGLVALRTRGPYFLLVTLALSQVLWGIALNWRTLTGGDDGLAGVARPTGGVFWDIQNATGYYWLTVLMFVFSVLLLLLTVRSPFGYALKGIRDEEKRMRAFGYNTFLYKYVAFVIAGSVAGLAGASFVFLQNFVNVSYMGTHMSAESMVLVILGGAGTLAGPLVATLIWVPLESVVSMYSDRWMLISGVIFIVAILLLPRGLAGIFDRIRRRRRRVVKADGEGAMESKSEADREGDHHAER